MSEFPSQARPVWIASYPRSGNTFLRILLERVFSLPSYSIYYSEGSKHRDPSAEALQEAPKLPWDWKTRLIQDPSAQQVMIKTHDLPTDNAPAIFIARDGRAAIHSYYHYHKKFAFEQPSLTEVIAGICQFGSWSDHYLGWNPRHRPQTLYVLYDELVSAPQRVIEQLAEFLKREPQRADLPEFDQLQRQLPAFFRRGKNADYLQEWSPDQISLFNQLHGQVMKDLGFSLTESEGNAANLIPELAMAGSRLHRQYLEQLTKVAWMQDISARDLKAQETKLRKAAEEKDQAWQRFLRCAWIKMGLAIKAVELPALQSSADAPNAGAAGAPENQRLKSSAGNTQSSSPDQRRG